MIARLHNTHNAAATSSPPFVRKELKTLVADYDRFAIITRESFADFLDRFAANKTDSAEWEHFVVQHYGDSFLEEIRRCVVRLAINELPIQGDTDAAREILRSWALLLRASTNAANERNRP